MKDYVELSSSAQNAYADLFEAALALSLSSTVTNLNGSFGKKTIKGKAYWYFQYRGIDSKVEQVYVGVDNEKIRSLIEKYKAGVLKKGQTSSIQKLSGAAIILGCEPMLPKHFRIIRRLSEYGFFKNGGILVGTHAYMAMVNMLGISAQERTQTQDIDLPHSGKNISIAMPSNIKIALSDAITSLNMGLLPISTVEGKFGASYLNPLDPAFRIDFLTSKNSESDEPVYIENLSIAMQPLKFMQFSMVDTLQSVIFCNEGAVVVNIPKPDRFAIHKLIVSSERKASEMAKINKDVRQANTILEYYMDFRPNELLDTFNEAISNGQGWKKRLDEGVTRLFKINPELANFLMDAHQ